PGASIGARFREGGEEKPQGAENSALKNKAPFNATPPKISENASISFFRTHGKKRPELRQSVPCSAWACSVRPGTILVAKGDNLQRPAEHERLPAQSARRRPAFLAGCREDAPPSATQYLRAYR